MIFVDANVLLDVLSDDPLWAPWSLEQLNSLALEGQLATTDIVYAEVSLNFRTIEQCDGFFVQADLEVLRPPHEALFLAARAHRAYRRRGGTRPSVLPDFLIGAHASILGVPLLTRDIKRFRNEFPSLHLIAPKQD
jgi:predicted nucleic acid-binding protein